MIEVKNEEKLYKTLKRVLDGWRMALIELKPVFLWEKQWYPAAIILSNSILFLVLWLMDLSLIETFAMIGLTINFLDFIVIITFNTLYTPSSWTGQKEKQYEDICKEIVGFYRGLLQISDMFFSLKTKTPVMFYASSASILIGISWVTSSVNNTFLLYICTLILSLIPGLKNNDVLNKLLSKFNIKNNKSH